MSQDPHQDLDGDWQVVEIDGETVDPDAPRTVGFDQGRISGRLGVNRFTGSYSVHGETVAIGPLASTRMAGPPELMALEARFNSRVSGEHVMQFEADQMTLGDDDHSIRLTREPSGMFEDTEPADQPEVRELPDQEPFFGDDIGL